MLPCRYTSCQGNYCSRRVERASSRCEECESVIENLWRPSPSPQPPSSPAARERKGGLYSLTFPSVSFRSYTGSGRGGLYSLTFPRSPSAPARGAEGGISVAAAILRLSTIPRSRPTPLPQRGSGAEGEGFPFCGRGRGDERSSSDPAAVNDTAFTTHPSPAARERGWG